MISLLLSPPFPPQPELFSPPSPVSVRAQSTFATEHAPRHFSAVAQCKPQLSPLGCHKQLSQDRQSEANQIK